MTTGMYWMYSRIEKKDAIQGQIHNPKHLSSVTLEQLDLAIFGIFNQNSTRKRSSLSSQY